MDVKLTRGMRWIALTSMLTAASLIGTGTAQAGVLTSANGTITYIANPGERNDTLVSTGLLLGSIPVYTFKDLDSNPVSIGGGTCQLINAVGMCRTDGDRQHHRGRPRRRRHRPGRDRRRRRSSRPRRSSPP